MNKTIQLSTGKEVKVWYSEDSDGPRDWCNLGTVVAVGNYSNLNDNGKHDIKLDGYFESREDFIEKGADMIRKQVKDKVVCILPIHVYNHSGVALSTSMSGQFNDPWDSGTCGFIFVTNKDIRENWGLQRISQKRIEQAEEILKGEIETLSQWVSGEVYGYTCGDDSCGGFYGSDFNTNGMLDYIDLTPEERTEFLAEV